LNVIEQCLHYVILEDEESIDILCLGFNDESALLRHEIAFVLGQIMHPRAIPSLINVLKNMNEHPMARHEAAEALGSIANEECLPIIQKYVNDNSTVVKESCEVALDMTEYWNNDEIDNAFD